MSETYTSMYLKQNYYIVILIFNSNYAIMYVTGNNKIVPKTRITLSYECTISPLTTCIVVVVV